MPGPVITPSRKKASKTHSVTWGMEPYFVRLLRGKTARSLQACTCVLVCVCICMYTYACDRAEVDMWKRKSQ